MMQFLINTLAVAATSGLAALAFYPILITNRAFILSAGLTYLAGGYAFLTIIRIGGSVVMGAVVGITAAAALSALVDRGVVRLFRRAGVTSWELLIATLGVFVVGQNILSMLFGDDPIPLKTGAVQTGVVFAGAHIGSAQLAVIVFTCVVAALLWIVFNRTGVGRTIRAVFSNSELAFALGHNPERIRLYAAIIGGAVAGLTGILVGLDTGLTPTLGFRLLLNGIVVILIVGMSGVLPILGGAFLLALLQSLAAMFWGAAWMESVAFLVLVALLIWKPHGLSGRRLKRVQI